MPRNRVEKRPQVARDLADIALYPAFRFLDAAEVSFEGLPATPDEPSPRLARKTVVEAADVPDLNDLAARCLASPLMTTEPTSRT